MTRDLDRGASGRDLIVCCDGTNNTLTAGRRDTNVLKLYHHLRAEAPGTADRPRLLYYDPGVGVPDSAPPTDLLDGARRTVDRWVALASGRGVYENIAQAYLFLMRNWRDGSDRICLFGFSRGAFTARSVAGMVNLFGILEPQHEEMLPTLIRIYFSRDEVDARGSRSPMLRLHKWLVPGDAPTRKELANQVRAEFTSPAGAAAWVHWVGVWDTVESVGLPGPFARKNPSSATLRGKRIRHVRHALSLDEHRLSFGPRLYEEPGDVNDGMQTLKQRWFPGAHSDVGGGYGHGETGLSDAALAWMVDELAWEISVKPWQPPSSVRLRHDPLWSTPWWALAGMTLRDMRPRMRRRLKIDQLSSDGSIAKSSLGIGVPIDVIPAVPDSQPVPNEWSKRRSPWSLLVAVAAALFFLVLSGRSLLPQRASGLDGWLDAIEATQVFASEQLASLWGEGLFAVGRAPWQRAGQPGWAMVYDLVFIVAWGYLLARVSSRAFAWLADERQPGAPLARWRWLGIAPLIAVGGDVVEDTTVWLAMAGHAAGADNFAAVSLWLGGLASLCKFAGLAGCLPWIGLRYWISFEPGNAEAPSTKRRAHGLYALLLATVGLLAVWLFARTMVCWGSLGVLGEIVCRSHYAIGFLLAGAVAALILFGAELTGPQGFWRSYWRLERSTFWPMSMAALILLGLIVLCAWLLVYSPFRFSV